ncbi:MAG: tetratricopeptide repeat protein [Armatimonadota bacterium]|nr:tetratricopeptide repeat protein [Armatimonadota bacterium]
MKTLTLLLGLVLLAAGAAFGQAPALPAFDTSRLYVQEAEFTRAIQPYQQAISADARNARAQYWLGYAYLYAHRQWRAGLAPYAAEYLGRAEKPLQEAIKLDPGMVSAYAALMEVYLLMGDLPRADEVSAQMLQRIRPAWHSRFQTPPIGN